MRTADRTYRQEWAHVAEACKNYKMDNGISFDEFGRRVGVPGDSKAAVVANWIHAINGPSRKYKKALARLLGVDISFFEKREAGQELGPARKALALMPKKESASLANGPAEVKLLRSFEEHGDGTVTVRLNSRMPLEKAKEVFKILMDVSV
jgi:transcriptional regulator with XRE-family HTH domain